MTFRGPRTGPARYPSDLPAHRTELVLTADREGDTHVELCVARDDTDLSLAFLPATARRVAADLTHRANLCDGPQPDPRPANHRDDATAPRTQLALPPATGRGYDRNGPQLWHVEPWRDGHQVSRSELGRGWRDSHDEERAALQQLNAELDARADLVLGRTATSSPVTRVHPGQQWVARCEFPTGARTVTAVDGAQVLTDHGRTTVFALHRHYQLLDTGQETR